MRLVPGVACSVTPASACAVPVAVPALRVTAPALHVTAPAVRVTAPAVRVTAPAVRVTALAVPVTALAARVIVLAAVVALFGSFGEAVAQEAAAPADTGRVAADRAVPGAVVRVVPSASYRAGGFHRFLLGSGYRDLWAVPIDVEVLDLDAFAGGLVPVERGGGAQTRSLRLRGADGATYLFRSVDKDATQSLDPVIQESLAADILQDQISHILPSSALVVEPILEAAGVLHAVPTLYVMPDDPRLGEFRQTFAGMLGVVEIRPNEAEEGGEGFAGSERIVGSESFLDRIEDDQDDRIDGAAYLRARLLDVLVGDWDRHPDQWRWAAFDSADVRWWRPIPRDRDWAFSRIDGMMALAVAGIWPHYTGFRPGFPPAWRATWSARKLDRELLSGLGRDTWVGVARDLQARLTDEVLDEAVARMPAPHRDRIGTGVADALRQRRDGLVAFAESWYAVLAEDVDVYATDEEELAIATFGADGSVRLTLAPAEDDGTAAGPPFFDRTFFPAETDEVRLYLRGGEDHFVSSGDAQGGVVVRAIGGGGDDRFGALTGTVRHYDDRGDNEGPGIDETEYDRPRDTTSPSHAAFARDWGSLVARTPTAAFDPDNGLILGGSVNWIEYGFRRHPYARRFGVSAALGTLTGLPRIAVQLELPAVSPGVGFLAEAVVSGLERDHFYGFGNETPGEDPDGEDGDRFFRAERWDTRVGARLRWAAAEALRLEAGPFVRVTRDREEEARLVGLSAPYGSGPFEEAGFEASARWDALDHPPYPEHGMSVEVKGLAAPAVLDVVEAFARAEADLRAYLTIGAPFEATLGLRGHGAHVWGDAPYHEAPSIGGRTSVRGLRSDRYTGDSSASGTAELRVPLAHFRALVPGEIGLLGLADVGRVWVDFEDSSTWHSAAGGGVWVAVLERRAAFSAYVAHGGGRTAFYAGSAITF